MINGCSGGHIKHVTELCNKRRNSGMKYKNIVKILIHLTVMIMVKIVIHFKLSLSTMFLH